MPDYVLKISSTADLRAVFSAIEAEQKLGSEARKAGVISEDAGKKQVKAAKDTAAAQERAASSAAAGASSFAAAAGPAAAAAAAAAATLVVVSQIAGKLIDATAEGVRFNAAMESSKLSIAAIYRQFSAGKFTTFDEALAGADKATAALQAKAATTSATFQDLLGSYQGSVGSLYAAGISDVQKQVDTVGLLANAVAAVVADKSQLLQETKAILTGDIGPDAQAAKILQISAPDIARAKEAGQLYEYLEEKLSAFAEAGVASGETFNVAWDNAKEAFATFEGTVTKPIFDVLRDSLVGLNKEFVESGKLAAAARTGANAVDGALDVGGGLLDRARDALPGAMVAMRGLTGGNAAMDVAGAMIMAMKEWQSDAGKRSELQGFDDLQKLREKIKGSGDKKEQGKLSDELDKAIKGLTEGLAGGTFASPGNAQATLTFLQNTRKQFAEIVGSQKELHAASAQTAEQIEKAAVATAKLDAAFDKANAATDKTIGAYETAASAPADRLAAQIEQLGRMREDLAKDYVRADGAGTLDMDMQPADIASQINAGGGGNEARARHLTALQDIVELMGKITAEARKQSDEGAKAVKAESEKAAALKRTEDERQDKVRETLAEMREEQDIELARLAGNESLVKSLEIEHKLRKEIVALDKIDPSGKLAAEAKITAELQKQLLLKQQADAQAAPAPTPGGRERDENGHIIPRRHTSSGGINNDPSRSYRTTGDERGGGRGLSPISDWSRRFPSGVGPSPHRAHDDISPAGLDAMSITAADRAEWDAEGEAIEAGRGLPTGADLIGPPASLARALPTGADMFGPPDPDAGNAGAQGAEGEGGGGGGVAEALNKAAGGVEKAAGSADKGAEALEKNAEKLEKSLGDVKTGIDEAGTKTEAAVGKVLSAVTGWKSKLDAIEGRVTALENR